jgi:hypothetical protein
MLLVHKREREEQDMRILDARFKYTPSTSTNVVATWKRHGYKPTTEAERNARQRRAMMGQAPSGASVLQLDGSRRNQRSALRFADKKSAGADQS